MEAIKGIFDGKTVILHGTLPDKAYNVIVIFEEEIEIEQQNLREVTSQLHQWEFWENEKEDLYQEYKRK